MMRSGVRAVYFIAVLLLVTSCTYDFSEDYFNDIKEIEPDVNLSLIGLRNGEEISSSRMLRYNFTGVSRSEFEMAVLLDNVEIHWSQESTGEFYLPIDYLEDGGHTLTLEFAFPSNSGSLAGKLGGEYIFGSAVYDFTIDKSLASSFGIASVKLVEGSIYITLNPVADKQFEEAYLMIQNEHGYVIEERLISEEDLTDLEIHDDETTMYNPHYAIKVKNPFAEDISEYVMLPTDRMEFTTEPIGYDRFKLIYSQHPLYANFDKLQFNYTYRYSGGSLYDVDPGGGETIVDHGYFFGEPFMVNFMIFRDDAVVENISEPLHIGGKLPFSWVEEITYVASLDKYFILEINNNQELEIHQLNGNSFEVEKSKTLTFYSASGDINSLEVDPVSNALIINMNQKALVFDPATFSVTGTHKAVDYNAFKSNADVYYRGDYVILEDTWHSGEVLIYERATGIQKFSITKTTKFFSAVDAGYFYANGGLYELKDGDFVLLKTLQDSQNNRNAEPLEHMTFDKVSNTAVFGWYRNTYFLDLTTYSQTYLWGPHDVYDVKYTEDGKPLINSNHFSAGTRSHLYNPDNKEFRVIDTYGQQSYRYFNGVIFSSSGFYLESDLYIN